MARLATKVKTDVNVVVCIKEESGKYTWRIAKAVGKPRPAKAGERDHDGVSFGASKSKGILVVDVHQYDVIKRNLSEYGTYGEALDAFENDPQSVAVCLLQPNGDVLEEVESMWDCCGLHEATQIHIPSIRYPRAVWIQNGNAHTSSDKGSKTSKQTRAVLLFYFHWPVAANQPEYRRVRCGVITVHSAGRGQRLSLSHVPHGITWHFAYLNSACYRSRN